MHGHYAAHANCSLMVNAVYKDAFCGRLARFTCFPGNRLEKLKGGRAGQYSIRINDPRRICFKWSDSKAKNVEIVDFHG